MISLLGLSPIGKGLVGSYAKKIIEQFRLSAFFKRLSRWILQEYSFGEEGRGDIA